MTSEQVISEAASENTPKRKRGRPRVFSRDASHLAFTADNCQTERGKQETYYATIAWDAFTHRLSNDEIAALNWLLQATWYPDHGFWGRFAGGGRVAYRQSIMAELGRLMSAYSDGFEAAHEWARDLCAMDPKPTTKAAVAGIRWVRLAATEEEADG